MTYCKQNIIYSEPQRLMDLGVNKRNIGLCFPLIPQTWYLLCFCFQKSVLNHWCISLPHTVQEIVLRSQVLYKKYVPFIQSNLIPTVQLSATKALFKVIQTQKHTRYAAYRNEGLPEVMCLETQNIPNRSSVNKLACIGSQVSFILKIKSLKATLWVIMGIHTDNCFITATCHS